MSREQLLTQAGIAASRLENVDLRIPLAEYSQVLRAALATTGDPALGLHMGEQAHTGRFDVLGPLAENSPSLRDLLQMSARYGRIVNDGPQLELAEDGDTATVRITLLRGESPEVRFTAEFVTASLMLVLRRFVGSSALPRKVLFAYAAPAHRAEYTRIFAGREHFSQDFVGLELERSWLERTQLCRSPELCALLQARAELLLARVEQDAPAAQRVARWLEAHSLQSRPTMEVIARDLGMSARSLRRRLREERARYSELVEDARARSAKRMLKDTRRSVQDTAYEMGFDSPAAFSRAFKRWTGMSPNAYRAR